MSAPVTATPENAASSGSGAVKFQPSPPNGPPVQVRLPNNLSYTVQINSVFDNAAVQTIERVRNRRQWRRSAVARQYMAEMCQNYLKYLGLNPEQELAAIAKAGVVEIGIPATCGEAAFIFPWEFVISQATASLRGNQPLLVIRHLERPPVAPPVPPLALQSLLIVQSAPGTMGNAFSFESEHKLVQSSFEGLQPFALTDPTLAELQNMIAVNSPAIIHFAGVDALQGAALLNLPEDQPRGMFFADDQRAPIVVDANALAFAAACGKAKPWLVSYNIYNSSWPLASQTVLQGAQAAVGFQDEIDDAIAEFFFGRLYEAYQRSSWDLLFAYREAWKGLSGYGLKLRGTGIVLWFANSMIGMVMSTQSGTTQTKTPSPPEPLLGPSTTRSADAIQVVVDPPEKLNYSMLHNNCPLFKKFEVKRQA